jgi:miniconductance mechanosensitive channel
VLLDKSPLGILGGIGALTAILILVFRDTILSLVASIQLVAEDLVRRGDWIEMPDFGADGEVIDIALHTVKVQNWDKTIITIPTYKLIDGSFQNWRGMSEAGGRRIKRSLLIDQASVRFCDDALMEKFRRIRRLEPYLEAKRKELKRANAGVDDDDGLPLNHRILTNLGTFRAYIAAYLEENAKLRKDMTFMVRQLPPSPDGLPLEIYVFTNDTKWVNYEGIQADIFDHLLAAMSYFDLRVFQHPTGHDLHRLQQRSKAANPPDGVLP